MRSGLAQDGRRRTELGVRHFVPDERDVGDLILFGQRFAKHIRYYGSGNVAAGNWSDFFESDESASLAALAKLPVEAFRGFQRDLETWLRAVPGRDPAKLSAHAKLLFHLPVTVLRMMGEHHQRLAANHAFAAAVPTLIARDLGEPLTRLLSSYRGAVDPAIGLFADTPLAPADYNDGSVPNDDRVRMSATIRDALDFTNKLSKLPISDLVLSLVVEAAVPVGETRWSLLNDTTVADPSPYEAAAAVPQQRYHQVYDALTYNLLGTAVERIYQGLERIRREAAQHLKVSLESFAGHAPHYALWLTFLQLFQHARGTLNEFTGRHLDFYFREVLRLVHRPAVPDRVHLLFELAKGNETRLLRAGTGFSAGKDTSGKHVSYRLDNDLVVNRASVAELRGLFVEGGGTAPSQRQVARAALVVQSRDGTGKVPLSKDDPGWAPFGPSVSPLARVGFAIADRQLFLREGTRTIVVRAELDAHVSSEGVSPRWTVRLSGAKGWFVVSDVSKVSTVFDAIDQREGDRAEGATPDSGGSRRPGGGSTTQVLKITVTLQPDDPPIVPLDPKVHGVEHAGDAPVMEVMFDAASDEGARAFAILRDVAVHRVTVNTSASGLKDLVVVAGGATSDVSRPFPPFGAQPGTGADLIIGSSEVFSKQIDTWRLHVEWEKPYSETFFYRPLGVTEFSVTEAVLTQGKWHDGDDVLKLQLSTSPETIPLRSGALIDGRCAQTVKNPPLDARSVNGFVRLRLNRDFGHAAYRAERHLELVHKIGGKSESQPLQASVLKGPVEEVTATVALLEDPREPYTPVITRLEASYETTSLPVERFSLLHPFGITGGNARGRLFPDFPFEGALFIGVNDLRPPARLTLLMQVLDGSGDPLRQAPALAFSYLSGDRWRDFESRDVDDKSRNFTTSGVLGLNVPEAADAVHGVMPTGMRWIMISTQRDAEALNRLLSVDAQAGRATFVDAGNAVSFLETALAAGKITRLSVPDPAIKKVVQRYSSFDGRPPEGAEAFATRVSERLRHKDRAITVFDYEALVLEAFPRLYRVKCLSTTQLMRDGQNAIVADNEVMPGAVTVVTVPWTHGQNTRSRLRPYTDRATLGAVERFLRSRVSPFVRLETQNPKFEEVHVRFLVRFHPGTGDIAFFSDVLNESLIRYLTPWSTPGGADIAFGGKLFKSSIIDFVEEQSMVDYVTEFRMYHKVDADAPDGSWSEVDVDVIEATTARSILVSAARHGITVLPDA